MSKLWSTEDLEFFITNYPLKGVEYCAKVLNRSNKAVAVKASKLGLKMINPNSQSWSEKEIALLIANYSSLGPKECIKLLHGRTYKAITAKAGFLNLKAPKLELSHKTYESMLFELQSEAFPIETYINSRTPILHECPKGHTWKVKPHQILTSNTGCPECADYTLNLDKPTILYYVKLSDGISTYYKVGITGRTVLKRFSHDRRFLVKVLLEKYFDTGREAKNEEKIILEKYIENRSYCDFISSGNTEVFEKDVLNMDK